MVTKTEAPVQVQVVSIFAKDTMSKICHYFPYISVSFHGDLNKGTGAGKLDLDDVQTVVRADVW